MPSNCQAPIIVPLRHMADAFLLGHRTKVEAFIE